MRIQGVQTAGQSLSVDAYNQRIQNLNQNIQQPQEFKTLALSTSKLNDRNIQGQLLIPESANYQYSGGMLPLVSAKTINPEINPVTGKPIVNVSKAPTLRERFRSSIQEEEGNYVKGIVNFFSGESARAVDMRQQKRKDFVQSEGMINLASAAPQAVYFTPYVGQALMVAGGAEQAIRSPTLAGKALGAGEAGLGLLGANKIIKNIKIKNELKALENTPLKVVGRRLDNNGKGVDFLLGYKKIGKSEYLVKLNQPFFQVGKTRTALEGGTGTTYRLKGNKLTVIKFESGGRVINIDSSPRITKGSITQELKNVQAGGGRLFIKVTGRADLKLSKGNILPSTKFVSASGSMKKVNQPNQWQTFTGISKEGEGYFDIISGQAKKARYYPLENKFTILAKPGVIGRIKVKNPNSFFDSFFSNGGNQRLVKGTKSAPIYAESLLKSAAKQAAPKTEVAKPSSFTNILKLGAKTEQASQKRQIQFFETKKVKQQTKISQLLSEKDKQSISQKPKLLTNQQPIRKQRFISVLDEILKLKQKPESKIRSLSSSLTTQRNVTKQRARADSSQVFFNDFFKPTPKGKIPFTPIVRPKIAYSTKGGKIVNVNGRYVVFIRRFGQDGVVGEASNLTEAKIILKNYLTSSLGASGFISQKGRKDKINVNLGFGFRPAKREKGRVVQEDWFRLGSRSERREIQSFKTKKTKSGGGRKRTKRFKWW